MKLLFSSSIQPEAELLKGLLDNAGIPAEIRNETVSQNFPGAPFQPEIWVLNDGDYPRACLVRDAWRESAAPGNLEEHANKKKPTARGALVGLGLSACFFLGLALLLGRRFAESGNLKFAFSMVFCLLVVAALIRLAAAQWPGAKAKH